MGLGLELVFELVLGLGLGLELGSGLGLGLGLELELAMARGELDRRRLGLGEQVERGGGVAHIEQRLLLHGLLERHRRGHDVLQCVAEVIEALAVVEVGGEVQPLLIGQ